MEQLEKVCKALGQGFGNGVGNAISFQYPGMEKEYNVTTLLGDALDLIRKQQERIKELEAGNKSKPVKTSTNSYGHKFYYCPNCGRWFEFRKPAYCDQCGQEVKWE